MVILTAAGFRKDREKGLAAGMNGYIPKPIDPLVLARELEKWLR